MYLRSYSCEFVSIRGHFRFSGFGLAKYVKADLSLAAEERKEKRLEGEIAKLKTALADKTLENDFFRSALLKIKGARQNNTGTGAAASTPTSKRGSRSKAR